jgi:acetyl/propionyl-CoA carboxylase alpha subunit
MTDALLEYDILGLRHNISFLIRLLRRDEVRENKVHTRFIEQHLDEFAAPPPPVAVETALAMAAWTVVRNAQAASASSDDDMSPLDPWGLIGPVRW